MENNDVKEIKDILIALGDLGALVLGAAKDGVQISDGLLIVDQLIKNPQIIANLKAAVEGIADAPAEIKDLSFPEGIELSQCAYEQIKKVLAAKV